MTTPTDHLPGLDLPRAAVPFHFLTVEALGPDGSRSVLDLAHRAKRQPAAFRGRLAGGQVGMIFEKPSTRTRVSFEAAAWGLGMLPIALRPDELQLGRGETIADTGRVLSRYLTALTVRTFDHARVEQLAASATIPIVNALTDDHHPCQALADVMTMEEAWGSVRGRVLAYVGDGNNVLHSLAEAAALTGFTLRVATPPGYEPQASIIDGARAMAERHGTGGRIELGLDPGSAAAGADGVYTDVWTSMGQDAEQAARRVAFQGFRVDDALMSRTAPGAIFLHCLPAHRGEEVTDEVIDGPASRVWDQAENRLHTELALLYALISGDWKGDRLA
jgi:ornithine carbamoyltransferase